MKSTNDIRPRQTGGGHERMIKMNAKVNEILQYLLGETKIKSEGGYYELNIQDEGDTIHVTVDRHNNCVFNESYSTDRYSENPFSFDQLRADLEAQNLDEVDRWIVDFIEKK